MTLKGGGTIKERLLPSAGPYTVRYIIWSVWLPVKNYISTMVLECINTHKTRILWQSTFDKAGEISDAKIRKIISGIYTSGFDGLKRELKNNSK